MRTDPKTLHRSQADVLVLGAGVGAATIAGACARSGLQTVLACGEDYVPAGAGWQAEPFLHHGLIRLLQGRLGPLRSELYERERMLRRLPHLVRPLPRLVPLAESSSLRCLRFALGAAAKVTSRRSTLPAPQSLDPEAAASSFPGLDVRRLSGGFLFWDARVERTPYTLALVHAARRWGARTCNHLRLLGAEGSELRLLDSADGTEIRISAKTLVLAGPDADALRQVLGGAGPVRLRSRPRSLQLVPERDCETSLLVPLAGSSSWTEWIPGPGGGVIRHVDSGDRPLAEQSAAARRDLGAVLVELPQVTAGDPCHLWVEAQDPESPDWVTEPGPCGAMHTWLPRGGLVDGLRAERSVQRHLGIAPASGREEWGQLPCAEGPQDPADPLWWRWGGAASKVRAMLRDRPELAEPLCTDRPHLAVEAVYALRHCGVRTFADLMLRRLGHPLGPSADREGLARAHRLFCEARPDQARDFEVDLESLSAGLSVDRDPAAGRPS